MIHDFTHRLGHVLAVTSLLILLEVSRAFQPRMNTDKVRSSPTTHTDGDTTVGLDIDIDIDIDIAIASKATGSPFPFLPPMVEVDLDKAKDFASHFGKYSFEEVEHMRDDLHADRLKNDSPNEVLFLERYLEDELTSQLLSLKEEMPDPSLFQYSDEVPDPILFDYSHTEDLARSVSAFATGSAPAPVPAMVTGEVSLVQHNEPKGFDIYRLLLHEGVKESLVCCLVLGFLVLVPQ